MHLFADVAAAQAGRISREQLHAAGCSDSFIRDLVRKGVLFREHSGVYAVGHPGVTRRSRHWSAILAAGEGTALSHASAGAEHVLCAEDADLVEVTRARRVGSGAQRPRGVRVHRTQLRPDELAVVGGLPVTSLLRTLLDLAASRGESAAARAFEEAQVRHGVKPYDLRCYLDTRRGDRGAGRLRRIADETPDGGLVRSVLEVRLLKLCRRHGLPIPLTNVALGPWEVDALWPDARLVLECQSRWHRTLAKRRRDAEKRMWLTARGFVVETAWWTEVTRQPARLATRLRAHLEA